MNLESRDTQAGMIISADLLETPLVNTLSSNVNALVDILKQLDPCKEDCKKDCKKDCIATLPQ